MRIRKALLWSAWTLALPCNAQKPVRIEACYTTELQTDFRNNANWVNLLRTEAQACIGKRLKAELATLSVCRTAPERLTDDRQVFSNIEEENLPLAIALLDIRWQYGCSTLSAGIRNLNEDYFNTEATSLFTHSSSGMFPTIAANFPIANYPLSALGADWQLELGNWQFETSIYNGKAYGQITGKNSVFRLYPAEDGLFGITSINYENNDSNYHLGAALYWGQPLANEDGNPKQTTAETVQTGHATLWTYTEQKVTPHLRILLQASYCLARQAVCRSYAGAGIVYRRGKQEAGLLTNYADYGTGHEQATELTWKTPIGTCGYLQPAIHLIRHDQRMCIAGLVRCVLTLSGS